MPRRLPARDLELLRVVGRFRMLTRAQAKHWLFEGLSEPVVTRCIDRLSERGYLGVERLHGNGIQILWLTRSGCNLLVDQCAPQAELFPATGPAAAKDFAHTMAICDVALWLAKKDPAPDELLPAWAVQRLFEGQSEVFPDLLAIWRAPAAVLLVEVDLGNEPARSVLAQKLTSLNHFANERFGGADVATVIFVETERRRTSILRSAVPKAEGLLDVMLRSGRVEVLRGIQRGVPE